MSAPTISVIIPTFNEVQAIGATLAQFASLAGCWEVIVADSSSTDGTREIVQALGCARLVDGPPGRGAAMNAGAACTMGQILLFLHADTHLPSNAYALIVDHLSNQAVNATAFRLRVDRDERRYRLLTPVSRLRFSIQRTFFGDQAIAVRRADFERVGGYQEPYLMEDVDLSRRLRRLGELRLLPAEVVTSARRFEQCGILRSLALMTALQLLYDLGVPAERLRRLYSDVRQPARSDKLALSELAFVGDDGCEVSPRAWRGHPVLLVFMRWLG